MVRAGVSHSEIAGKLGRTRASIRNACSSRGWVDVSDRWSDKELKLLVSWYTRPSADGGRRGRDDLGLASLAESLGRDRHNVCRKAKALGLTDKCRRIALPETIKQNADRTRKMIAENGHPRGALGMKHTPESLAIMGQKSREASRYRKEKMPLFEEARNRKAIATRIARFGTGSPSLRSENAYSRCKRGRREDLGGKFFRSRWEANYARYLKWLHSIGEIQSWEYEPHIFRFEGVSRGPYSYLPDFRVVVKDGTAEWHEVKGWMDAASRGKLKRFAKFYPGENLVLIDKKQYTAIQAKVWRVVPGWET